MRLPRKYLFILPLLLLSHEGCFSRTGLKVSGDFSGYLKSVPFIGVEITNYGKLPWQKERVKPAEEELRKCLPPVLDNFCGPKGCRYVYSADDPDAFRQKHELKIKFEYERSAHFRDGFVIIATYEMRDSADIKTIIKYRYMSEPKTKIYYEQDMDKDEVFTVEPVETAKKFCEALALEFE